MKLKRRVSPAICAGLSLILLAPNYTALASEEKNASQLAFEEALDIFYWGELELSSANLHFLQSNSEDIPITLDSPLGFYSEDNSEERALLAQVTEKLTEVNMNELSSHQKQVYLTLTDAINMELELLDLPDYAPVLGDSTGLLSGIDTLFSEFYFRSEADVDFYLTCLQDIPRFLEEVEKEIEGQENIGFAPVRSTIATLLEREDYFCDAENINEHPYLESFVNNIPEAGLSDEVVAAYTEQVTSILANSVIPAYQSFFDYIEEKQADAPEGKGLCYYDQGSEYYSLLARNYSGTDMDPGQLYDYLESKIVDDITSMSFLLLRNPNLIDQLDTISIPVTETEEIVEFQKDKTNKKFPTIHNSEYQISYLPESLEVSNIVAYYLTPPYDLQERNIMRVNKSNVEGDDLLLWTTLAHEGFPGHLYQTQYYYEYVLEYPVEMLLMTTGVQEGWALYTERIALEWANIDDDLADVYAYNSAVSMAISAMADIGIHYKGWDVDELGRFFTEYFGDLDEEVVQEMYDAFIADPAVYLAYGVGYYQICDLFDAIRDNYRSDENMYAAFMSYSNLNFTLLNRYLGSDGSI